jgi:hypothetical protein
MSAGTRFHFKKLSGWQDLNLRPPRPERYNNCVYVLSKLDNAEAYLKVDSFSQCFNSAFWATRCVLWYGRDAARDTVDENAISTFNAMMDAKEQAEERCSQRLGKVASETEMAGCIADETKAYARSLGLDDASIDAFNSLSDKARELYEDGKKKTWQLYEGGKKAWGEVLERWEQ